MFWSDSSVVRLLVFEVLNWSCSKAGAPPQWQLSFEGFGRKYWMKYEVITTIFIHKCENCCMVCVHHCLGSSRMLCWVDKMSASHKSDAIQLSYLVCRLVSYIDLSITFLTHLLCCLFGWNNYAVLWHCVHLSSLRSFSPAGLPVSTVSWQYWTSGCVDVPLPESFSGLLEVWLCSSGFLDLCLALESPASGHFWSVLDN